MLQAFAEKAKRFKPQSASVRNVMKLAGGSAASQVITLVAMPILTRLYGPASFGVLAIFASILALLNVVSSLRYELAIAVPEEDNEAITLVWLCFVLVLISTALTALGVILFGSHLASWFQQPTLQSVLWLLPVGVFFTGLYQPLSYWAIRNKEFGLLARTKFRQSSFGLATNLLVAPFGTVGLILGQIVSQSSGFLVILLKSSSILSNSSKYSLHYIRKTLLQYSHFGIYSSSAGLINAIGNQFPVLIFSAAFGASQLGQLAIAQRLLLFPVSLIGSSIGKVFLSTASEQHRQGRLSELLQKAARRLLSYGLIIAILIGIIIVPIVPVIFGVEWVETKSIILALLPIFVAQIVVSPLSMSFVATQKVDRDFFAQAFLTVMKLVPIAICFAFGCSFLFTLMVYSFFCVIGYIVYLQILFRSVCQEY